MGEGHVAKGGTIRRRGKSCFPRSTLIFVQTVSASKPSSAVQTPPIRARCCKSFFSFFSLSSEPVSCDVVVASSTSPRPHTGVIPSAPPRHRNYRTNLVAATTAATSTLCGEPSTRWTRPHMRRGHTQATPPPSPSLCLVHLKKASDKSFPFFSPSSLTVQDTSPRHRPIAPPCGPQAPPPPPPRPHVGCPFAIAVSTPTTTSMPLQLAPLPQPHCPTTGVT